MEGRYWDGDSFDPIDGGLDNDSTVYVATTGSDTTGNGSSGAPYATITKAISMIPKDLSGYNMTLNIAAGTYGEVMTFKGFSQGWITITLGGNITVNGIDVWSCAITTISPATITTNYIGAHRGANILFGGAVVVTINGGIAYAVNNSLTVGVIAEYQSKLYMSGNIAINNTQNAAILGLQDSNITLGAVSGTNNTGYGYFINRSTLRYVSNLLVGSSGNLNDEGAMIYRRTGGDSQSAQSKTILKAELDDPNLIPGIYNIESDNTIFPNLGAFYTIYKGIYNGGGYCTELAIPYQDGIPPIPIVRKCNANTWGSWMAILTAQSTAVAGQFNTTTTAPTNTNRLNYEGYLYATKVYSAVFNDYAEYFEKGEQCEPGDIVANDLYFDRYVKARIPYNNRVVGVVSDSYAYIAGGPGDGTDDENYLPVGMAGRVKVKVTGDIHKGDLIVQSDIPGVGMASDGYKPGTVVGKALENHKGKSVDKILMLIMNI